MINEQLIQLIGNTPLINLNIPKGIVLAKMETNNLTGSIKDRMALFMLKKAESQNQLKPEGTIITATTGNTGIAFAALAKIFNYKMIAVMPKGQSIERIKMLRAYNAQVILTPKSQGVMGTIIKRDLIAKTIPNSFVPNQFNNPNNIQAHFKTTGPEIIKQLNQKIDYLVHGVGTGGTLMGVGKYLKKYFPNLIIVAVEPSESAVLSGHKAGEHNIQGIGEGFIPPLVDQKLIDIVIRVSTKEAINESKKLANKGLLMGYSSGANISAIKKLIKTTNSLKTYLTIFADRGERYLEKP
ncbi:MAG: cysteine synthase family protein [Candidatus Beckwithbacteria bacterium]|nr:cysteine synthase family protein [Patescibacteria group bacterium]